MYGKPDIYRTSRIGVHGVGIDRIGATSGSSRAPDALDRAMEAYESVYGASASIDGLGSARLNFSSDDVDEEFGMLMLDDDDDDDDEDYGAVASGEAFIDALGSARLSFNVSGTTPAEMWDTEDDDDDYWGFSL